MPKTKITTNPTSPINAKKKGGQKGNRNALKHGFYARHFTQDEIQDFEEMKPLGVYDEIQLVRALMRRVLASSQTDTTHAEVLETFRAICLGNFTLSRLIRTQILDAISPLDSWGIPRERTLSNNNYYLKGPDQHCDPGDDPDNFTSEDDEEDQHSNHSTNPAALLLHEFLNGS
jgi:hypothetical protein